MGGLEKNNDDVDCRAIKKGFLEKFKLEESGKEEECNYNAFLKLVKKYSDELVLCFRGNNPKSEAVCIYYNNHVVYQIECKEYKSKKGHKNKKEREKIIISFNHARYSREYDVFWRQINREYGFNPEAEDVPEIKVSSYPYIKDPESDLNAKILENVEIIYKNCLRPMMIDYFNPDKTEDFFKGAVSKGVENRGKSTQSGNKDELLEKIRQQQLFCKMKSTQNGLFVFDLEFSQPSELYKKVYGMKIKNQPDMLAVRFDKKGKPCAYVFVEVKCTTKLFKGASGVIPHLKAMIEYSKEDEYMKARRREAALIINQYKELGLYPSLGDIDEKVYEKLSVEIMLIFTDDAVSKYENEFDEKFNAAGLSNEYKKEPHGDLGIHLPSCKRLEIVEIKKI